MSISRFNRAICAVFLVFGLNGCTALQGAFEPIDFDAKLGRQNRIEVQSLPIALMSVDPTAEQVGRLAYRGGLFLKSTDRRFGSFSGLVVSEDGTRMLAVSQGGYWFTAELVARDGRLSALKRARLAPMLNGDGKPLAYPQAAAKAVTPAGPDGLKGPLFVSFERKHRVWRYPFGKDGFAARPQAVDIPKDAQRKAATGGIQGIVALDANTLFAQSEDTRDKMYDLQGWLVPLTDAGQHGVVFLKASGAFKPTALAALPGGDIFVLERSFSLSEGASMQIRRLRRTQIKPLAVLDGEVLAKLDVRYSIDNMEGLAVRRGAEGETLLYVLSNDNYNGLQRTVLLEFALNEGAAAAAMR